MADDLRAYERRFRRAGLPLLIEDYSAREDVFTRAAPVLQLVFIAELLGATSFDWRWWQNALAILGALGLVLVAIGLLNRSRGRAFSALPQDVGPPELVAFVLVPALLPLIFGFQYTSALVTALGNLALLGIAYAVVGYGMLSIVRWAGARLVSQLAASLTLLARALPLLLVFSLLLMLTTEVWQVFSGESELFLALVGALFVGLGTAFLVGRLPREVARLEHDAGEGPELTRAQRLNVGLVLFISQSLQVLVVSLSIGLFFVVFGALAIPPEIRDGWIGSPANVLVTLDLFGDPLEISEELLRVSGGIAAFSGLYYAIAVLTDSTYRAEFLEELTGEMRATFHAHAEYLKLRAS
ncbi:MAG: hypothetical protein ACR2NH_08745 [Solirubrobacteraceae bacterium]